MLPSLLLALSAPPQYRDNAPDADALVAHPSAWSRWTQTGPIACSRWGCTHRPPPNATAALPLEEAAAAPYLQRAAAAAFGALQPPAVALEREPPHARASRAMRRDASAPAPARAAARPPPRAAPSFASRVPLNNLHFRDAAAAQRFALRRHDDDPLLAHAGGRRPHSGGHHHEQNPGGGLLDWKKVGGMAKRVSGGLLGFR